MQFTIRDESRRTAMTVRCDQRWRQLDAETLEGPRPSFWAVGDDPTGVYDVTILLDLWYHWERGDAELDQIGAEIVEVTEDGQRLPAPRRHDVGVPGGVDAP
jgi:hypothetical protein